jgi:hypothetical protein
LAVAEAGLPLPVEKNSFSDVLQALNQNASESDLGGKA